MKEVQKDKCPVDTELMIKSAERQIDKLMCELKEKEYALQHMCDKSNFYEQIVRNLTVFN